MIPVGLRRLRGGTPFLVNSNWAGVYFPTIDTVVVDAGLPEVVGHEFSHRYSATRTGTYPAFRVLQEIVACKHLLIIWLTSMLERFGQELGVNLYIADDDLHFETYDRRLDSDLSQVLECYYTVLHLWQQTFTPWFSLLTEFVAVDLGVSQTDGSTREQYIASVIDRAHGFSDYDGDFVRDAHEAWLAWVTIADPEHRQNVMTMAMSFPSINDAGRPTVLNPLAILRDGARRFESDPTSARSQLEHALESAARSIEATLGEIRRIIQDRTWPGTRSDLQAIGFLTKFRQLQASSRGLNQYSAEDVARGMRQFPPLFYNMPPGFSHSIVGSRHAMRNETPVHHEHRLKVTLTDLENRVYELSSDALGAYYTSEDKPFMRVDCLADGSAEATLNPFFVAGMHIAATIKEPDDWWRDLLFYEALRSTLDSGTVMSCPLKGCRVRSPFVSEVAETMRRIKMPVPRRYDVACRITCPIRRRMYLYKTYSNFVSTSPFCGRQNLSRDVKHSVDRAVR